MRLDISFLHNADPHLPFVGIRTDEIAVSINRKVVIDFDTAPIPIEFQFDDVFSFWIVDRFAVLVLREDVVGNKPDSMITFKFVMR